MRHGVYTNFSPTSIQPPAQAESAIAFVVGTSAINMGDVTNVNKPILCNSYKEAVQSLGFFKDFKAGFSLNEVIYSQFVLFAVSPIIFVNVLDPVKHKKTIAQKAYTFADGKIVLDDLGVIKSSVVVKLTADTPAVEGTDYSLQFADNGKLELIKIEDGAFKSKTSATVSYDILDPSKVTSADIIGGIDTVTGKRKGLELIDDVYSLFNKIPALVAAPAYSHDIEVSKVISKKSALYNSVFRAFAVVDISDSTIKKYSDAVTSKNSSSLNDSNTIYCFPKAKVGDDEYHLSTLMLGLFAATDNSHDGVPYKSPSNETLPVTMLINNGEAITLNLEEANFLNSGGIVTAFNFIGGFKAWGNRTGSYPAQTDVRYNMINNVRMFNWFSNELIVSYWSKVDFPLTKRGIDSVIDSGQYRLDGLVGAGALLGGRILFNEVENPTLNLMDGKINFKLYLTPPSAAEEIGFDMEYDPKYLETLFK